MGKGLAFGLALVLALTLSAAAEQVIGTVTAIDRADHVFVLEDGTRLSVSDRHLTDLTLGDQVKAVYETQDGTKVVTGLDRSMKRMEWSNTPGMIDPNQAE